MLARRVPLRSAVGFSLNLGRGVRQNIPWFRRHSFFSFLLTFKLAGQTSIVPPPASASRML